MFRMRAFDQTLVRYVYWNSSVVDNGGLDYTGPGPLVDIVVTMANAGDLLSVAGEVVINLIGVHNDVDLWSGGVRTSWVEVDLVGGGGATLTGIDATGFRYGNILYLWNGGGGSVIPGGDILTLRNQSSASLPGNRLWVPNGKDLNIPNNDGVVLIYVGNSWTVFCGSASMVRAQELSLDPVAVPAALANGSTNHNLNPFALGGKTTSYVRQDTGLLSTVTGIVAAGAPNSEGRLLVFQNISATGTIVFKHLDGGSVADNRIICPGSADIKLGPRATIIFVYDDDVAMWRVASASASALNPSDFTYMVTGLEAGFGTSNITVPIPGRLSTSYTATATDGGRVDTTLNFFVCPVANYTTTTILVQGTQEPAVGDKINILIQDTTS